MTHLFLNFLQEFADYINELSPDQAAEHRNAIEKAQAAARDLAELREKLEQQRKETDEKLQREMEGTPLIVLIPGTRQNLFGWSSTKIKNGDTNKIHFCFS